MTHPFKTHEGNPLHGYTCSFNRNDFTISLQFSSGVFSKLELENGGGGGRRIKIFEKQKKEALVMVMYNFAKKLGGGGKFRRLFIEICVISERRDSAKWRPPLVRFLE